MTRLVALHGLPTHPGLWARLPLRVEAPALRGLGTPDPRSDWSLESFVEELLPALDPDTVLVGHDLGGVVAAMAALRVPLRRLVLTGTALGPYWAPVRATAWPLAHRYFYDRWGGRRFLAGAVAPSRRDAALAAFDPARIPDLPARMRAVAAAMRPPLGLARRLRGRVPVTLLWGARDPWYPAWVARAVARGAGADLVTVPGGHLCMWEEPEAYAAALAEAALARR